MSYLKYMIMKKKSTNYFWLLTFSWVIAGLALFLMQDSAIAAETLKDITGKAAEQIKAVTDLLIIIAYVAGVGFCLGGILQFKAHKDAPTQTPLSKPIVLLIVGGLLLALPTVLGTVGSTIFGDDKSSVKTKADGF